MQYYNLLKFNPGQIGSTFFCERLTSCNSVWKIVHCLLGNLKTRIQTIWRFVWQKTSHACIVSFSHWFGVYGGDYLLQVIVKKVSIFFVYGQDVVEGRYERLLLEKCRKVMIRTSINDFWITLISTRKVVFS